MYGQNKMEYDGFVATIGANLDIINPNEEWYDLNDYDDDFYSSNYADETEGTIEKKLSSQIELSPRLSISHPITESSSCTFNYGHYQQMPISKICTGFSEVQAKKY